MERNIITPAIRELINLTAKTVAEEILQQLKTNMPNETHQSIDDFLSAEQAAQFLKIKLSTLYSKVSKGDLPHSRSGERKLLFSKKELTNYINKRRVKTKEDIKDQVESYIINKRR